MVVAKKSRRGKTGGTPPPAPPEAMGASGEAQGPPPGPFPSRFTNLDTARARFGDKVDRLAPYLFQGDPLADAAAEALSGSPPGQRRALIDEALDRGVE